MLSKILSLFENKKCYVCGQYGQNFCQTCRYYLKYKQPQCYLCKKDSQKFYTHNICQNGQIPLSLFVCYSYREPGISKALKAAKYYKKFSIYTDLVKIGRNHILQNLDQKKPSILVPVPMHFFRRMKRGYNQTEILSHILSKLLNIPVEKSFLVRNRATPQQARLSKQQREKNLENAFTLRKIGKIPKNMRIYLVDDVVSSGATLFEITKLLHSVGYHDIHAITLASD